MDICEKFGVKVHKFRTEKGISQEKLAELSELHRTYISAVERGARSISLKNIEKIATALEVEPYLLFQFGDEENG